jgi:hypothetical protein
MTNLLLDHTGGVRAPRVQECCRKSVYVTLSITFNCYIIFDYTLVIMLTNADCFPGGGFLNERSNDLLVEDCVLA